MNGHLYAFALAGVGLVGAIVLAAIGKAVPVELWSLTFGALGAGAGISLPGASSPPAQAPTPPAPPG